MQITLADAPKWLEIQTPKEYVQQIAAASEGLRKATSAVSPAPTKSNATTREKTKTDLLADFRALMQGAVTEN